MFCMLCMQTDKMTIEFQNSIVKLSLLCCIILHISSQVMFQKRRFINQLCIYLKKGRSSSRYLKYKLKTAKGEIRYKYQERAACIEHAMAKIIDK